MYICDEGARNLAAGVVHQAVIDYRFALRMSRTDPRIRKNYVANSTASDVMAAAAPMEQLEQIERFFRGRWFAMLVDIDGEWLLGRILDGMPGKRLFKPRRTRQNKGTTRREPVRPGKPGRPIDWEMIAQWPDIKRRLDEGGYSRKAVAFAMGLSDASVLVKLMRAGTEQTRWRMEKALERLEDGVRS